MLFLSRGCPCGHGRQRRAAGGGGQPGQRVDPETRLQEHTRYSELTLPAAAAGESTGLHNLEVAVLIVLCVLCLQQPT